MDPLYIGFIAIVLLLVVLALGMPVAFGLGFIGFAGLAIVSGFQPAMALLATTPFGIVFVYTFVVLPLFVLMGEFAVLTELHSKAFATARLWLGRLPGGLALASIGACTAFAAASGSSIASTATIGRLAIGEMRKHGYSGELSAGTVVMGGALAATIPPSAVMIIYAFIAEVSIAKLFFAGIVPGLLAALAYSLSIVARVKLRPQLAPVFTERASWKERLISLKYLVGFIILAAVVMGGIYTGFVTVVEASALGASVAFCMVLVTRKATIGKLRDTLYSAAVTTCMVNALLIGGNLFSRFLTHAGMASSIRDFVDELPISPLGVIATILLIYVVLGMFFEAISMMFITLPFFVPIVNALGFDLVWFGILVTLMVELATVTPPVGIHLFVAKGVAPDISLGSIIRGSLPLLVAHLVIVGLVVIFPDIALWLPGKLLAG